MTRAVTRVAVINGSSVLSDDAVAAAVPALQTQVHRDFAAAWGIDADVVFVAAKKKPPAGAWWLAVLDDSDQAGALGYHDLTNDGLPLNKGSRQERPDLRLDVDRDREPRAARDARRSRHQPHGVRAE